MSEMRPLRAYQPSWWLVRSIRAYQRLLSPSMSGHCRYRPTCSEYMAVSVTRFGLIRGVGMGLRRVGRCHPFRKGGYDPVPDRRVWTQDGA